MATFKLVFPVTNKKVLTSGKGSDKVGFRLTFRRRPDPEAEKPGEWVKAVSQVDPAKIRRKMNRGDLAIILTETVSDVELEEKRPEGFYIIWLKVTKPTTKADRWAFDTCLDELGVGLL